MPKFLFLLLLQACAFGLLACESSSGGWKIAPGYRSLLARLLKTETFDKNDKLIEYTEREYVGSPFFSRDYAEHEDSSSQPTSEKTFALNGSGEFFLKVDSKNEIVGERLTILTSEFVESDKQNPKEKTVYVLIRPDGATMTSSYYENIEWESPGGKVESKTVQRCKVESRVKTCDLFSDDNKDPVSTTKETFAGKHADVDQDVVTDKVEYQYGKLHEEMHFDTESFLEKSVVHTTNGKLKTEVLYNDINRTLAVSKKGFTSDGEKKLSRTCKRNEKTFSCDETERGFSDDTLAKQTKERGTFCENLDLEIEKNLVFEDVRQYTSGNLDMHYQITRTFKRCKEVERTTKYLKEDNNSELENKPGKLVTHYDPWVLKVQKEEAFDEAGALETTKIYTYE